MDPSPVRVRFAPSPTGHLHLGNVRTALFNWLFARGLGGTFILRLEDTDAARSTQESVDSVLDDLRWLGLDWDEGPKIGGPFGPYRQTERYGIYRETLESLVGRGKAYPCFCTQEELDHGREQARAAGRTYVYPGTCRRLSAEEARSRTDAGAKPAYRLRVQPHTVAFTDLVRGPVSIHTQQFGDWILTRPDGSPTYNFAVVVDDALMKVTHVIRGEDHLSNTPKQLVLYEALDLPAPAFAHLSMILGPDGGKLSKRHGDVSLDAFRARGFLPEGVVNGLALLGWSDPEEREILDRGELVARFSLDRMNKSAATFDEAKLRHVNREHMKRLGTAQVAQGIRPFLAAAGRLPEGEPASATASWLELLAELLKDRMDVFADAPSASDPVFTFDAGALPQAAREELASPEARKVAEAFLAKARSADLSFPGAYREAAGALKKELGVKGRGLFHPLRLALTASESGPDLERLVPILELGSRLDLPSPVLGPAKRVQAVLGLLG